ncbi:hypothetical protein Trco_003504 [Trichoderma cornu-damae]|uniref:Uncharacterized protein n=1 Tax=Trichoderma cornu-damae TaxID=654480 RepID=A0A9P8TTB4_9HYPO|nr:hypothetical protein Trco_003504 [Trichoderma cornu-damae]
MAMNFDHFDPRSLSFSPTALWVVIIAAAIGLADEGASQALGRHSWVSHGSPPVYFAIQQLDARAVPTENDGVRSKR